MPRIRTSERAHSACRVYDFDEALLAACPPSRKVDVLMEAQLLAGVFASGGGREELERMAAQLSCGERDGEMSRAHARLLAAALRHLVPAT